MTRLHAIGDTLKRRERLIDVVFVHGAGGHYLNSWGMLRGEHGGEKDSMLYWLLEDQQFKNIGVWSLEHESDKTIFGIQGSINRGELAGNLLQHISPDHDIRAYRSSGATSTLWWIAHSDGGNVVKRFLKFCQENNIGQSVEATTANWILKATRKVHFIDTPHRGAPLADLLSWIPISRRATELRTGNKELQDTTIWFFDKAAGLDIEWLNFHQTDQVRFKVVATRSAVPYGITGNISIDRNHKLIAKPASKGQEPYAKIQTEILSLLRELQAPVAAITPQVQRQQEQNEATDDPCRLLIFVAPVPGYKSSQLLADRRYSLRCWFKKGASEEPRVSTQSWLAPAEDEAGLDFNCLGFERLADVVAGAYIHELNHAEELDELDGGSLLPVVFLPVDLLTDQALSILLDKLDEVIHRRLGQFDFIGMPLLLACSSRWPVSGAHHPLMDTQRFLKDASKRVEYLLWTDQHSKLSNLQWLSIAEAQSITDPDQPTPTGTAAIIPNAKTLDSQIMDRIILGKADDSDRTFYDAAFQRCEALHLQWRQDQASSNQADWQRLEHLLFLAKPVIWCDGVRALCSSSSGVSALETEHPMEFILALNRFDFLQSFQRFRRLRVKPDDPCEPAVREYIRRSTLFWEDHRYLPPITPAATRLRIPFQ